MCATVSNLYNVRNSNYNNNYLFDILLCLQLFVSNNTCSPDLYSGYLQTTTVLFTRTASSHQTNWITTTRCLLCLVFLLPCTNSLTNVLEVECSCLGFLENSFLTSFLFVYFVHIACCIRLVVYLLFWYWCCCWLTYNKFDICFSVASVYRFEC